MLALRGASKIIAQSLNNTGQVDDAWAGEGVTINTGSVLVDVTSRISADGQGYVGATGYRVNGIGPGAGMGNASNSNAAGGAGYGGIGGYGDGTNAGGGRYGSVLEPTDLGSSGGMYYSYTSGAGGGAIRDRKSVV